MADAPPAAKPRLKATTARLMLAREMWARDVDAFDYSGWDDDELPTVVYEKWIARADSLIREAMARGD